MNSQTILIEREFNAPKELLFRVWTEKEHLMNWWGPKGFKMQSADVDLKVGGRYLYHLSNDTGVEMWGRFIYTEISPSDRLQFIVSFSDENGGITKHPMSQDWPSEMENTVTFLARGNKTLIELEARAIRATETEAAVFTENTDNVKAGNGGMFDVLEEYLTSIQQNA